MLSAAGFPDRRTRRFGPSEAALGVVVLVWATSLSIIKYGAGLGNPYLFNLTRLTVAALCLLVLAALAPPAAHRFRLRDFGELLLLALCGHTIFQTGLIHGTDASSASSSALILSLTPVAIAAIAWATRTEPFCHHTAAGLALSVSGILFVSGTEERAVAHLGNLGVLCAMLGWAIFTVRGAAMVRRYGALRVGAWTTGLGTLLLWLPAPFLLAPDDFRSAPDAFWMAAIVSTLAGMVVGNTLWSYASGRVGPTLTGVYSNVLPLPAILISWVWLGEALAPAKIAGALLIVGGIAVARLRHSDSGSRVPAPEFPPDTGAIEVPRRKQ